MEHELVSHATFVVERMYPDSPPARVFAAYAEREAKARWSTGPKHWRPELELDFRVGGRERYRGRPPDGSVHAVDAWYLDIEPDRRIVYAYDVRVGDTRLIASLATVELRPEGGGTRLVFTEQGAFFGGDDTTMFVQHMRNVLESLAAELGHAQA